MAAGNIIIRKFNSLLRVFFVEKRLPYSWSRKWHEIRYRKSLDRTLKNLASTFPVACSRNPEVEVHLVTCKRDLYMAVASVKSLIRYFGDLGVVFHGDPSLDYDDSNFLREQIPGCRYVSFSDAERSIKKDPNIYRRRKELPDRFKLASGYDAQRRAWALKVFDFHFFSDADRVIVLDSDTLFLKRPNEVVDFIEGRTPGGFYAVPCNPNLKVDPKLVLSCFPMSRVIDKFNGGFFGFDKSLISIDLLIDVVDVLIDNHDVLVMGDECIWRFAFGRVNAKALDFSLYPLVTDLQRSRELEKKLEDLKYIHFILKHKGGFYQRVAEKVGADLKNTLSVEEGKEYKRVRGFY